MRTIFVIAVGWSMGLWVVVGYVPARFQYSSELRLFAYPLFLYAVCYAMALRAMVGWTRFEPMPAPWTGARGDKTHQFFVCFFFAFLAMAPFAMLQAFLADESNPGGWMVRSPCSASSCTSQENVHEVYNAGGFFTSPNRRYTDYSPTLCLYSGCQWANGNEARVRGYAPEVNATGYADVNVPCVGGGCLATNRAQDYPNLATGLSGGFFDGFGSADPDATALCPGSYVDPGTGAVLGRTTCAYCVGYLRKHEGYSSPATAYCPSSFANDPNAADDVVWCSWVCPRIFETSTPSAMRRQSALVIVETLIPLMLWSFVHAMSYVKRTCKALKDGGKGAHAV